MSDSTINQHANILDTPDRDPRTELDWFGVAAAFDPGPPRGLADGNGSTGRKDRFEPDETLLRKTVRDVRHNLGWLLVGQQDQSGLSPSGMFDMISVGSLLANKISLVSLRIKGGISKFSESRAGRSATELQSGDVARHV
jgi:hypothetical protein